MKRQHVDGGQASDEKETGEASVTTEALENEGPENEATKKEELETAQPPHAPAPLLAFAELCQALAQTSRKLEKRSLMVGYLRALAVDDAARAVLYLAGTPFAETDPRRLQVGGSTLAKAVQQLSGASATAMHEAYRRHGDLGDAAYDLLNTQQEMLPTLTLAALEEAFTALALARGPAAKLRLLLPLLGSATPLEARYLIKLATGDMRTGVKQSLVEEAVAACHGADAAAVRRAVMLNGSLAEVVRMAAAGTLAEATMRLFHPLGFMLASPVDSVDEALARFAQEIALEAKLAVAPGLDPAELPDAARLIPATGRETDPALLQAGHRSDEVASTPQAEDDEDPLQAASPLAQLPPSLRAAQLEDKYDGMRAQLHCGDPSQPGRVGLFSRNREDLSESFPELIEAFAGFGEEVILDGEILAWRPSATDDADPQVIGAATGRALPFASLQQRLGRKRVSAEMRQATPVVFMAFDLLYHHGELLLEQPLSARRARLEVLVATHAGSSRDGQDAWQQKDQAQSDLFHAARAQHAEASGFARLLLAPAVKLEDAAQLDAAYTDARSRGNEGVMLKASGSLYQPGRRGLAWLKLKRELATLDVVITGAEFGHGRRAGVLSDYTFAIRANAGDESEPPALLNVGKAYSGLTDVEVDALSRLLHEHTLEEYGSFRTVEPVVILEVAFNNVTRSERHSSGFALRFPRILRIRTDKPLAEIDTLARVEEVYASQPDKPVEV